MTLGDVILGMEGVVFGVLDDWDGVCMIGLWAWR